MLLLYWSWINCIYSSYAIYMILCYCDICFDMACIFCISLLFYDRFSIQYVKLCMDLMNAQKVNEWMNEWMNEWIVGGKTVESIPFQCLCLAHQNLNVFASPGKLLSICC